MSLKILHLWEEKVIFPGHCLPPILYSIIERGGWMSCCLVYLDSLKFIEEVSGNGVGLDCF